MLSIAITVLRYCMDSVKSIICNLEHITDEATAI